MVGWGDNTKLPEELRDGGERVRMFENGRWQSLRPFKKATAGQAKFGLTELTFGPEIAFAHEIAKAWPEEKIGIIKHAIGGSSILTWKPEWSKQDADRVGQGRLGSLYQQLLDKVNRAKQAEPIEVVGFLWVQGGKDMRHLDVGKAYLQDLKSLVMTIRKDTGVADLPFLCASPRRTEDPDDLSGMQPQKVPGPYPAVEYVLKAHWDIQKEIPNAKTIILRDIDVYPKNVHYNTAGQLEVGRLFAAEYLKLN